VARAYIKLGSAYQTTSMTETRDKRASIQLGRYAIPVPETRWKRSLLGWCLTAAGLLPVVGWGFLPLGLLLLSVDNRTIRRGRRWLEVRWGRWRQARKASQGGEESDDPGQKERAGIEPGPKALGNGGVSSREDNGKMTA
jgi:hypothetical protein